MANDLSSMWQNLSLVDDEIFEMEAPAEEWRDVTNMGQCCVVGKLAADRFMSKETIKSTLLRWWKLSETFSFKVLGENLFLIEFTDVTDKNHVLDGCPWVFEGSLFLIEDFDGRSSASEITFAKAAFWVCMMDLPLACIGRETGKMLGSSVGIVEAVDIDEKDVG